MSFNLNIIAINVGGLKDKVDIIINFLKNNKQYKREDFDNERTRITNDFRNNGAYDFKTNYISYNLDTINTNKKANISLLIKNYSFRKNDTTQTVPFKLYKISKLSVIFA